MKVFKFLKTGWEIIVVLTYKLVYKLAYRISTHMYNYVERIAYRVRGIELDVHPQIAKEAVKQREVSFKYVGYIVQEKKKGKSK